MKLRKTIAGAALAAGSILGTGIVMAAPANADVCGFDPVLSNAIGGG